MQIIGQLRRRVLESVDVGMRRRHVLVVGSAVDDGHHIALEQVEELFGDVVATERVLEGQIELVVDLDAFVTVVRLAIRTERLAAAAEHVQVHELLQDVDVELAPRIGLAVRYEPDGQFALALGPVGRIIALGGGHLLTSDGRVGQPFHEAVAPENVAVRPVRHRQVEEVFEEGQLPAGEAPLRRFVRHHDELLVLRARTDVRQVAQRRPVEQHCVILIWSAQIFFIIIISFTLIFFVVLIFFLIQVEPQKSKLINLK